MNKQLWTCDGCFVCFVVIGFRSSYGILSDYICFGPIPFPNFCQNSNFMNNLIVEHVYKFNEEGDNWGMQVKTLLYVINVELKKCGGNTKIQHCLLVVWYRRVNTNNLILSPRRYMRELKLFSHVCSAQKNEVHSLIEYQLERTRTLTNIVLNKRSANSFLHTQH